MSGFEIIGVILGAYPLIVSALDAYKATRGDKGAVSLARNLKTEEIIFGEFVHHLVAPNVSETDLVRLTTSTSPDLALWNNDALKADMKARLGSDKTENVVGILQEIQELLDSLHRELAPSDQGVLQRLLADRSLPGGSASHKRSETARRYIRRDPSHVVDLYNAICDGYRCKCKVPHLANFSLPRISDEIRTESGLVSGWQFELLFATAGPAVDEYLPNSNVELEGLMTTWSQIAIGGDTVSTSRRVSITECDNKRDLGQPNPMLDLCIFTSTFDSQGCTPDRLIGFLRRKEKQYQLQIPTTSQGTSSPNVECLDHLLTDQSFLLSRKERIRLALSLSHAILSFYSTPWIGDYWTWKDFCIDRQNEGQLFATQRFYSNQREVAAACSCGAPNSSLWAIHGEPTLTRLGFALIELALGKRLVELRPDHQNRSADPDTLDFLTAKNLLDSGHIMRAESQAYEDVVRVCLQHQFIRSSELVGLDSSRPSFQENAEQSIIAPLHTIVTGSWGSL
ncbi:MAG: hypothetical protein Q9225_001200 [Loekoesia sp. 1 TL-2023]